jgi:endonuclease-3
LPRKTASRPTSQKPDELATRARTILRRLKKAYPDAGCPLIFKTPHQLLVATILSAQAPDKMVNRVTPGLFRKYKTVKDFASATQEELEGQIHTLGFFRNKAKSIRQASQKILEDFGGEVPRTMEEMLTLPGVARKTANVVLGNAYGVAAGIVVDTHVIRLSRRMGLSQEKDPVKIEQDLMALIPKKDWILSGHLLTAHGRAVCTARKPKCEECPVAEVCPKLV